MWPRRATATSGPKKALNGQWALKTDSSCVYNISILSDNNNNNSK